MKLTFALLVLSVPLLTNGQTNPFDSISYDKVIAYEFQGDGGRLIQHCLENERDKISKTIELSNNQVELMELTLTSNSSYGSTTASCFDPHLALIYYKDEKVQATVDICLECNYLISSIEIPAISHEMIRISEDYSYPAKGFSKLARKSIHQFCTEIGFIKYLKPLESIFDE